MLDQYFEIIITSEKAGAQKPHKQIFDYALTAARTTTSESIIVGDSIEVDMQGAKSVDMDHIYFNPDKQTHKEKLTHEISSLRQLKEIL